MVCGLLVFTGLAGASATALAAPLASPGDLDSTFGDGGKVLTDFGSSTDHANALVIQPDGKIVAAGTGRPTADGREHFLLARYNPDGSLDSGFGDGGWVATAFNSPELDSSEAAGLAIQPDGKLIAVGWSGNPNVFHLTFAMARYNPDGSLDSGFGDGGRVLTPINPKTGAGADDQAYAVTVAPDGRIVVAGEANGWPRDIGVAVYNTDGSLDTSFGDGGKVMTDFGGDDTSRGVVVQGDGKIVVAGMGAFGRNDWILARYNADGSLDSGFGNGGKVVTDFIGGQDWVGGLALVPGGKIVVAGEAQLPCPFTSCERWGFALAQYNPDGSLDSGFGDAGKVHSNFISTAGAFAFARSSDGRLVLSGHIGSEEFAVAVYHPNGFPDTSFGAPEGFVRTDLSPNYADRSYAVAVQSDGRIVAAGTGYTLNSKGEMQGDLALVRYEGSGSNTPSNDNGTSNPIDPNSGSNNGSNNGNNNGSNPNSGSSGGTGSTDSTGTLIAMVATGVGVLAVALVVLIIVAFRLYLAKPNQGQV